MIRVDYGPYNIFSVDEAYEDAERYAFEAMAEREREALQTAVGQTILRAAASNFRMFLRVRYGLFCPEPKRVLHPHQLVVADDLFEIYKAKYLWSADDRRDVLYKYWITAPRGFVKTSTLADYMMWRIGNDPSLRIKLVTQNERRAVKQLGDMARYMIHSPIYRAIFPDIKIAPNTNRTQFNVVKPPGTVDTRDATIEASGYNASPEGSRADIFWFDDVCTYANSVREEKERENIKEKMAASWFPVAEGPDSEMYWSCTLFHDEDMSHKLLKSPGWKKRFLRVKRDFQCIEDVREDTTYPLPAVRWNASKRRFERWWGIEELRQKHDEDPEAFRISHFLETVTATKDRARFPREFFYGDGDKKQGIVSYAPFGPKRAADPLKGCDLVVLGVDLAFGKRSDAANTAMVVVGYRDEDRKRVILDADYGKGMSTMEKLSHIKVLIEIYNPDLIVIEDNAAQKMLIEFLEELQIFDVTIEPHTTDVTKEAKLTLLSREIGDGKWSIPFPEGELKHGEAMGCRCGRCLMIREMMNYPDYATSDLIMATVFARHGLKTLGIGGVEVRIGTFEFGDL